MRRILVMGPPGSGKSRLARLLAEKRGLPVVHLDAYYWRPGWVQPDKTAWREQVAGLVGSPQWIMDGNYSSTLDLRLGRAEGVIWLECPTLKSLRRVLWRAVSGYGRTRPDMQADCPERIDLKFIRYVLTFQRARRPEIEKMIAGAGLPVVRLDGKRAVAAYLAAGA